MPGKIGKRDLLLLEEQDRNQWDLGQIHFGLQYLQESAQGSEISRYHVEAGIAAQHCLATSLEQTAWEQIVKSYELLETMTSSPFVRLNKVIAISQWRNPQVALKAFAKLEVPSWFAASYHWFAVEADLLQRMEDFEKGALVAQKAISLAPSEEIKKLLRGRFKKML